MGSPSQREDISAIREALAGAVGSATAPRLVTDNGPGLTQRTLTPSDVTTLSPVPRFLYVTSVAGGTVVSYKALDPDGTTLNTITIPVAFVGMVIPFSAARVLLAATTATVTGGY